MKWHWKVRIYNSRGDYVVCQIITDRRLGAIDGFQDVYQELTQCKMLLEGMSESDFGDGVIAIGDAFTKLWCAR